VVMFGLKYYWHFLLGFPFILLRLLMCTPHLVAQSAGYLDTLAEYLYTVQYRPGLSHHNADVLSRRPCNRKPNMPLCPQCGPQLETIDKESEEDETEEKVDRSNGQEANSVNMDRWEGTAEPADPPTGTKQPEAFTHVLSAKLSSTLMRILVDQQTQPEILMISQISG